MVRRATAAHTRMLLGLLNPGSNPTPFTAPSKRASPGPGLEGRGFAACSFSSQNLLFTDGQRAAELREPGGPRRGAGRARVRVCPGSSPRARSKGARQAQRSWVQSLTRPPQPPFSAGVGDFWPSNYLKATNMPAIRGDLPSCSWRPVRDKLGSRLPCPGGPPPSGGHAWPQNACHFSTVSQGPFARSLSARSAGGKTQAPARCPRRPSPLGVQEHHTPAGQPSPAALARFSGRLQATRRPTVARRPATRARGRRQKWQRPGATPQPQRRPPRPAGILPHASPPCRPALRPTPPFSPSGAGNSCRQLFSLCELSLGMGAGLQALPKGRVACRKVL